MWKHSRRPPCANDNTSDLCQNSYNCKISSGQESYFIKFYRPCRQKLAFNIYQKLIAGVIHGLVQNIFLRIRVFDTHIKNLAWMSRTCFLLRIYSFAQKQKICEWILSKSYTRSISFNTSKKPDGISLILLYCIYLEIKN